VEADALAAVERAGTPVRPTPEMLAVIQDKATQKQRMNDAGLPTADWVVAETAADLPRAAKDLGWPLMLKARKLGYDGYGNATCADMEEATLALDRLDAGEGVLVERMVDFRRELAVMVARNPTGEELAYPVVETVQQHHVCHEVLAPARIGAAESTHAAEVALAAAAAAGGIGVTGVELFQLDGGGVLVNELAPRPHNSGHYTIEACETSQFENHLRGVLDLPLGPVEMRRPAAAMVNILGTGKGPATPRVDFASAVEGAHIHLYGKSEVRLRRKMGHVTALGADLHAALSTARRAVEVIGL
jgi:5-(carboxyamino)imidazole ribonucleotide synthase